MIELTIQRIKLIRAWGNMGVSDEDILARLEVLEEEYEESIERDIMRSKLHMEEMEFERRKEMERLARKSLPYY